MIKQIINKPQNKIPYKQTNIKDANIDLLISKFTFLSNKSKIKEYKKTDIKIPSKFIQLENKIFIAFI